MQGNTPDLPHVAPSHPHAASVPTASRGGLLSALGLGTVPALLAAFFQPSSLQENDLLLAAVVLAVGLGMAFFLPGIPLARMRWRTGVTFALMPTLLALFALQGPVTNDERASMLQAELMVSGALTEPLASHAFADREGVDRRLDDVFRRRQVHEDSESGTRFAKYAPGTAFALTLGQLFGAPLLSTLLAGLLNLLLIYAIARRLGLAQPQAAVLLLGTSPFFLLTQTSMQSEVYTTPGALLAFWALLRARQDHWGWAAVLGAATGWVFLTRPLTGVVLAAAAGLPLLLHTSRLRLTAGAILGGLPVLLLSLAWNQHFTGSPWTSVYELYAQAFGPFFPGPDRLPMDVYGNGDFLDGLLRQGGRWSVAFGGMLGAVGLAFWGAFRLRARDGGFTLLFALLLPLAYAFHWYPGHRAYLGPLYLLETLPALLLALLFLLEGAPQPWRRGLLGTMTMAGIFLFAARWPLIQEESQLRSAPQRVVAEQLGTPQRSIIFLPPKFDGRKEKAFKYWTPSRPQAILDGGTVILRTTGYWTPQRIRTVLGLEAWKAYRFEPVPNGLDGRVIPLDVDSSGGS